MKGRIIFIILLFLMAIVLFSVAFVFYYQGDYLPFLNKVVTLPWVESPANKVIKNALENFKNVSTASYDLEANTSWVSFGNPFELDTNLLFDGRFDDKPRGKLLINNDIKIQSLTFLTTIEASLTEDKFFFQFTETPALPFLDLQNLKNKWYESDWSLINFGNFNQIYNFITEIFILRERLPDEVIDGQLSYHYLIKLNPDKFSEFYNLLPTQNYSQELFKKQNYDLIELEIWISKDNFYLLQAQTHFSNELLDLEMALNVTNYNQPISLTKPDRGAELNSLYKDLFGKTDIFNITVFSYLVGIEDDYLILDKDQDKLYLIWENIFGTDDNNTDTDEDGYNDIDEIKNGYNPNGSGNIIK